MLQTISLRVSAVDNGLITDCQLPDKAIDLIDEAASRIRMEIDSKPERMDRLERRLIQLKIEREALKKETDEASRKRLDRLMELLRVSVTEEEIAEVVSRWTGIPVSKMLEGERDKLLRMEEALHRWVVGQDEAVKVVADAIRRSRAGLADPMRPNGSFLFLGPTGVGKTELCKALAAFLFDTEEAMIRIDMSEFMEKHSVASTSSHK